MPNYNVSLAEIIILASDISEHISTAGTEASGTSNMKFAMNGGLLLGTMDGANIEIAEEIGEENMFIFGLKAYEVAAARSAGGENIDPRLREVIDSIHSFKWADEQTSISKFFPLVHEIQNGSDFYLVAKDFPSYVDAQNKIDQVWKDKEKWTKMCINTISRMGKFSSDRTILEYANDIWKLETCRVPESDDKTIHK